MQEELIDLSVESAIAVVALNRPDKRNAMNDDLRNALTATLARLQSDQRIRALILTGNGKSFCAGGDIAAMQQRMAMPAGQVGVSGWSRQQSIHHSQVLLHNLPIPTIAAVNGAAAGLGADIAMACDFVVASSDAVFSWAYIYRGLVADGGGMYFLPRRTGLARAKDLIFSGRRVTAAEALELGIADRVASPENLLAEARSWASELTKGSRTAIALGKAVLNETFESSTEQIFGRGSMAQGICYTSMEHQSAVAEFLDKVPAVKTNQE